MDGTQWPQWIATESERAMASDFRLFLWFMWRELRLPEPTPIQLDIAHYLQHGPKRRIIQAFRGVGKSWITAIFVLWLLWRDPDHRVLVVSASKERADGFSIFCKTLIDTVPKLHVLRSKDGQRNSNVAFDVGPSSPDQTPSVRSVGITGQMTGGRANTIVADDVEVPKNSATEAQREKLSEQVKEFDAVLKPGGQVVYLGTPQVEQSLYLALQSRGYECRIWPARYVGPDKYRGTLAPIVGDPVVKRPELLKLPTEPSRFSEQDLLEREASYGRSGFALQFMLDTSLSDANRYPLKLRDLIVFDPGVDLAPVSLVWAQGPEQAILDIPNVGLNGDRLYRPMYVSQEAWTKFDGSVLIIDPSGRGADETAFCVVKMLKGLLYVTAWGGYTGGYDETTLAALAAIAKDHKVNEVSVESNYGDGMFTQLFKPVLHSVYPCTVTEYKVTGQKEVRILDDLEPAMNQHRLVVSRKVLEENSKVTSEGSLKYSGAYQLTHLTKERGALRHDDRIEVLAAGVRYWTLRLGNDVRKNDELARAKKRDENIAAFMKSYDKLWRPRKKNWTGTADGYHH